LKQEPYIIPRLTLSLKRAHSQFFGEETVLDPLYCSGDEIPAEYINFGDRAQHDSNSPTGFSKLSHGKTHRFWAPGSR